ncbi:MAG: ATP synthase F1 subunit epsilon [Clostridiales bacterium]|jgi:F-type H+-transporting ATPase subunit epsilon|nr:ATP synthase F1 subunit epsilon [Clostridiales bacterium]
MAKSLRLKILTPLRELYNDDVDMVVLRGANGDMGILPGHETRAAKLGYGPLRILKDGHEENELAVLGGFAFITNESTTVLSDAAEWPDEIDRVRAESAAERARNRLTQKTNDTDTQRAELSLRRALVRIDVSSYPIIHGKKS